MKQLILFAMLLGLLTACGSNKDEDVFKGVFFDGVGSNTIPNTNNGLVLNLNFDESNTKDFSGNNNSAIIRGTVKLTTDRKGQANKAALFEGNGSLEVPHSNSLVFRNNVSVSFFFKMQSPISDGCMIVKGDNAALTFGALIIRSENSFITHTFYQQHIWTLTPFNNNFGWQHFAMTLDDKNKKVYINGNFVSASPVTGSLSLNTDAIRIGSTFSNGFYQTYFKGALDEIRVYNRALTDQEVARLYQQ
jgi:hypothetical protein